MQGQGTRDGAGAAYRAQGFTLIELMTAVLVVAILLAIAVPSFESTINNGRLATASNELLTTLQTARVEAIRYNHRTVVCLSSNAETTVPTCAASNATNATGWIAFVDQDNNGSFDAAGDQLLRQSTVQSKVKLLASSNITNGVRVTYRADGFARNTAGTALLTGALALCIPTRKPAENTRRVLIGTGGKIYVERKDDAGNCPAPQNS
jgi:type IV fimbrial biogenesis protein FimT